MTFLVLGFFVTACVLFGIASHRMIEHEKHLEKLQQYCAGDPECVRALESIREGCKGGAL